jgi:mannitol-specific phosphotransferase system IIBC component
LVKDTFFFFEIPTFLKRRFLGGYEVGVQQSFLLSLFLSSLFVLPMDRRKEELEKKRQKLAELRRAREERKAILESQSSQTHASTTSTMVRIRKRM